METIEAFLALVRLGIGNYTSRLPQKVDWSAVRELARQQGLSAIALDGVEKLSAEQRPSQKVLLEWIGEVLQGYEHNFERYKRTLGEMAAFYNAHGYKMMVLKGYACALDWPKLAHRPCGDIDIWQFGQQKMADACLVKERKLKIDNSHHHHTIFCWDGFMVENHYDFIEVHRLKSNNELERIFKELGSDDHYYTHVNGEKIFLPSPNLNALFLIRHMASHFAAVSITLRQILDWAFFVKKHGNKVDWKWLLPIIKQYHLWDFFNIVNAICVEELGFDANIFPDVQFNPLLKARIFNDIMYPVFGEETPHQLFPRLIFKYRRWKGNAWKQKLCFAESRSSAFWGGLWNHILKPSSI